MDKLKLEMQINVRHKHSAKLPRSLTQCQLEPDTSTMIQKEAIEVFTAMANSGRSFQHALQAVFLSGMSAATEANLNLHKKRDHWREANRNSPAGADLALENLQDQYRILNMNYQVWTKRASEAEENLAVSQAVAAKLKEALNCAIQNCESLCKIPLIAEVINRHVDDTMLQSYINNERTNPWKKAVNDAGVVNWSFTAENENNPRKAVADLVNTLTAMASNSTQTPPKESTE